MEKTTDILTKHITKIVTTPDLRNIMVSYCGDNANKTWPLDKHNPGGNTVRRHFS